LFTVPRIIEGRRKIRATEAVTSGPKGEITLAKLSLTNSSTLHTKLLHQDVDAQTAFVDEYLPEVVRYVSRAFPSLRQDAEDIALDALYNALLNISRFDPSRGNLLIWVVNQAKWRAQDLMRRKNQLSVDANTAVAPLANVASSSQDARRRLEKITEDEKQLLVYHFLDGLSYRKIAEQANCSHTHVAKRIAAILAKLK
jgi:RNA polymerase sigma factor (sigma-70 family)